jgi:hypothetical protein
MQLSDVEALAVVLDDQSYRGGGSVNENADRLRRRVLTCVRQGLLRSVRSLGPDAARSAWPEEWTCTRLRGRRR